METKFTKGKWHPVNYAGYWCIQTENYYNKQDLLDENKCSEAEANAKLIAAAPELLENLIRIIDRIEENDYQNSFPSAYERAKKAIKKATE